jgi:hypothetical protein
MKQLNPTHYILNPAKFVPVEAKFGMVEEAYRQYGDENRTNLGRQRQIFRLGRIW